MAGMSHLWRVVRHLCREHYPEFKDKTMRASYYIIGDYLAPLIGQKVTATEYDWFITTRGYSTYRDEIWVGLESKEGIDRPRAKSYGIIYDGGRQRPVSELPEVWDQARGFIFVEKVEEGTDIKELSSYGWVVIAGGGMAGFPTREIRQLLKNDVRPILCLHDGDVAGEGIYKALGFKTRRTAHLDIALGDRVTDLGMGPADIAALSLPTRPEPPKYQGQRRAELSALHVLTRRWGIEKPVLAYVVGKMAALGVKIAPTETDTTELLISDVSMTIELHVDRMIERTVRRALEGLFQGQTSAAVEVPGTFDALDLSELEAAVADLATTLADKAEVSTEDDFHTEAMELTTDQMVDAATVVVDDHEGVD